jgi:hypothetical protein
LKGKHETMIAQLADFLINSSNVKTHETTYKKSIKARRRHRETWCPGEGKAAPMLLGTPTRAGGQALEDGDSSSDRQFESFSSMAGSNKASASLSSDYYTTTTTASASAPNLEQSYCRSLDSPDHSRISADDASMLMERNCELEAEIERLREALAASNDSCSDKEYQWMEIAQRAEVERDEIKAQLEAALVQNADLGETIQMLEHENEGLSLTSKTAIEALEDREEQCSKLERSMRMLQQGSGSSSTSSSGIKTVGRAAGSHQQYVCSISKYNRVCKPDDTNLFCLSLSLSVCMCVCMCMYVCMFRQLINKERDAAARIQQQLQDKVDKLQDKIKNILKERSQDEQTRATMEREHKTLQRQLEVLEKERVKATQSLGKLKEITTQLAKTQKSLEVSEKRAETLESRCSELEVQLVHYQEDRKQLERALTQTDQALVQCNDRCVALESDKTRLTADVASRDAQLRSERTDWQARLQAFERDIAALESAKQQQAEQAAQALSKAQQQSSELSKQLEQTIGERNDVEQQLTMLEQEFATATSEWQMREHELEQHCQQQRDESERAQQRAADEQQRLQDEIQERLCDNELLNNSCGALEDEKTRLLSELTELNLHIEEQRVEWQGQQQQWNVLQQQLEQSLASACSNNVDLDRQLAQVRDELERTVKLANNNEQLLQQQIQTKEVWPTTTKHVSNDH